MTTETASDYTIRGTLRVDEPRALPEVLDVFIAGAGPAGTAAAFRAAELGLSCLVAEYDDPMSRIRDYPKEKHIYPEYGDDESPFPSGGDLITALQFGEVDKDDLVADWKVRYRNANVALKVGTEFIGLSAGSDGVYDVKTWNHRVQEELVFRARNVILALGAGKPRRFQIPGNIDGIAFRLDDAKNYLGGPALVIGGGTSAAEAVIAISAAKVQAQDQTCVYWSYRKDQMPRVEKSLSSAFFDAYVGNGNVRYLPFSEPILVLTAPDRREYLSVRTDRRVIEGRPAESSHLEFPKERVVACIGGDVPHQTLQKLGVKVPSIDGEPYMLVTPDGESSLPGVFLVGDLKGTPEYYQCTNFEDTTGYKKRRDKRNIKMAMRDAVRAIEVVAARSGKIEAVQAPPPASPPRVSPDATVAFAPGVREEVGPPPEEARIIALLPDGSREAEYPLRAAVTRIGRKTDGIAFDDPNVADHHASVIRENGESLLGDTGAGSGVWLRVRKGGHLLVADDQVWLGAQIVRVVQQGSAWSLEHYDSRGEFQRAHELGTRGLVVGRAAEVTLDGGDRALSRGHARFSVDGPGVRVEDIGSTNGTYVRLSGQLALQHGDEFRLATRRFRFEASSLEEPLSPSSVLVDAPLPPRTPDPTPVVPASGAAAPAAAEAPHAAAQGPGVSFEDARHPVAFPSPPDRDVLHAFFDYLKTKHPDTDVKRCGIDKSKKCPDDHYKEPLDWSCEVGTCGYCAVVVIDGSANLLPSGNAELEKSTLQNLRRVSADLTKHRLACLTRVNGPVTMKVLPKS